MRRHGQETMTHQISGFEILEKLGEGGMASVWKARQISLDRVVAIKILSHSTAMNADDIRRFQDEAQAAAKLKHSGIVQVYDANAENGMYYFIMEYVAGYTVGDWVRRKGTLSEQDALSIAECIAGSLGYAWERAGIIHCDIKPDNVIIDEDGTIKIADLGLARTIGAMEAAQDEATEVMGTPAYISPEQAQGDPDLDFRADIYSLGAMLYHLVTGKMMFMGSSEDEVLEKQITDTVEDPIDIEPTLSKGICWLIERMTAKDPELRAGSWDAVAEDIVRVRRGLLPQGRTLPPNASTVRRSRRRTSFDYKRVGHLQKLLQVSPAAIIRTVVMTTTIGVAVALAIRLYLVQASFLQVPVDAPLPVPEVLPAPASSVSTNLITSGAHETPTSLGVAAPIGPSKAEVARAEELYAVAATGYAQRPDDLTGAIVAFQAVARETVGMKYALMARQQVREIMALRDTSIQSVKVALRRQTDVLVADERFDDAIALVDQHRGSYTNETADMRRKMATRLKKQKQSWRSEQEQHRQKSRDSLLMGLLSNDVPLAMQVLSDMISDKAFSASAAEWGEVQNILKKVAGIDRQIMKSFIPQQGMTIDVQLTKGTRRLTVGVVRGARVSCTQALSVGSGAIRSISINVADLSARERLRRMGSDALPEVALAKGIMAFQSRAYDHAKKYFAMTHPLLAKALLRRLNGTVNVDLERLALDGE